MIVTSVIVVDSGSLFFSLVSMEPETVKEKNNDAVTDTSQKSEDVPNLGEIKGSEPDIQEVPLCEGISSQVYCCS